MVFLVSGAGLLALILGLFSLKDEMRSPRLARLAYSELTARLAVIAAGLMLAGAVLLLDDIWRFLTR